VALAGAAEGAGEGAVEGAGEGAGAGTTPEVLLLEAARQGLALAGEGLEAEDDQDSGVVGEVVGGGGECLLQRLHLVLARMSELADQG